MQKMFGMYFSNFLYACVKIEFHGVKEIMGGDEKFSTYIINENSPNLRPDKDSISGWAF
jgi:hypothetical protein